MFGVLRRKGTKDRDRAHTNICGAIPNRDVSRPVAQTKDQDRRQHTSKSLLLWNHRQLGDLMQPIGLKGAAQTQSSFYLGILNFFDSYLNSFKSFFKEPLFICEDYPLCKGLFPTKRITFLKGTTQLTFCFF